MVFGGVAIGEIGYAAATGGDPVLIHHSEDEGVQIRQPDGTWIQPTTTEGATTTDIKRGWIFSAAIARDNPDRMYAMSVDATGYSNGRFYTSSDGGVTWAEPAAAPSGQKILSMVSPQDGHVYIANHGISKSTNHGASWSEIVPAATRDNITGIAIGTSRLWMIHGGLAFDVSYANLDGTGLTGVTGSATGNLLSAASDDLVVWADAGISAGSPSVFKATTSTVTDITPSGLGGTERCWECHALSETVFVLLAFTGTSGSDQCRIWRTDDAGASWSVVFAYPTGEGPVRFGVSDYHHFASHFGDPLTVFVNGHGANTYQHRVYRSSDGGQTWGSAILNDADPPDGSGGWLLFGPGGFGAL